MAASLQSAATFLQSAKISTAPSRGSAHLRSTQAVGKSFGLETSSARLTCSFQSDFKDFAGKCSDAVKIAGFALATSALVVSVTFLYHLLSSLTDSSIKIIMNYRLIKKQRGIKKNICVCVCDNNSDLHYYVSKSSHEIYVHWFILN